VSAFEELGTTGHLGDAGVELLYRTVRAVVRARFYPDPAARGFWTPDELEELAHDVLVGHGGGPGLATYLLEHAVDDAGVARVLHTLVRSELADRGRRSVKGRLMLRLREILDDPLFRRAPGGRERYTLSSAATVEGGGDDPRLLRRAAFEVRDVRLVRWRPDAARHSPVAERSSLVAVCAAVLAVASGPVELGDLADVVADRFGIVRELPSLSWQGGQAREPAIADASAVGALTVDAAAIYAQLDAEERAIVPLLGEPVRVAAETLGWRRTRTHNVMTRAAAVIAQALGVAGLPAGDRGALQAGLGDAAATFQALVELAATAASPQAPPGES
jgi:hypothetical protein